MPWGDKIVDEGENAGAGQVEVFEGDATSSEDLHEALALVDATFYLIHSMSETGDFRTEERSMAQRFARAAEGQDVGCIVFLGGLHPTDEELSEHLGSRVEVGQIFLESAVPTAALQAGVVLGEGSISFRMLRHLSERLPGAIGPGWIRHKITPISVRDVTFYLAGAAELPPEVNRTFDIGGPDTLEYAAMMQEYAKTEGLLPRIVFSAPVTTPELAAKWISLITPSKLTLPPHLSAACCTILLSKNATSSLIPALRPVATRPLEKPLQPPTREPILEVGKRPSAQSAPP